MAKYYKWILSENFIYKHGISGISKTYNIENWGTISESEIIIYKPYSWDGCSPKISIFNWFTFGIWDGSLSDKTKNQSLYEASLVHDFLCQFSDKVPFDRKTTDKLFYKMMKEANFSMSYLYYWSVIHYRIIKNKIGM